MSLITLNRLFLHVGGNCLLDNVDWQIQPNDRIALVGRNGAGKSSLMKLLQGQLQPDSGQISQLNGIRVAGLTQEVPVSTDETVYHFIVHGLDKVGDVLIRFQKLSTTSDVDALARCHQQMDNLQVWDILPRIETMAGRLGLDTSQRMSDLSGGMKRRALLAAALIAAPDVLLLDEPTNHLDVNTIEWLESYLKTFSGSLVVVTHDRQFLSQVANRIVEIDRGKLHPYNCDYETYLDKREAKRLTEDRHNALFDKHLSDEEAWIRTGVKARRTRNEGRVRALKALREQHRNRREQLGKVKKTAIETAQSGRVVFEVDDLQYAIGNNQLVRNLSLLVTRGDKLGIIGPNGCGKTTLIRLLLKELQPDAGRVHQGTALDVAYFDQLRRQLNEDETVLKNVADGADYVVLGEKKMHVASYLRDFLFIPERFNQKVSSLSGGERNRLLLAKLFTKPVNLLIMDEPTNDLDIETLEMLENKLMEFNGTLLLISHDRAFINQVVTSVLVWEGEGQFKEHLGGYDDYKLWKQSQEPVLARKSKAQVNNKPNLKMSFKELRELQDLPKKIENLEQAISKKHLEMANPDFYQQDTASISHYTQQLQADEAELAVLFQRWECLEAKEH